MAEIKPPTELLPPDPNAQTKAAICQWLLEGAFFKDACVLAGSSEATGHRWRAEDESFKSQVREAILRYKQALITIVNRGSVRSPGLALEVLKIRWADQFNPPQKVELKSSEDKIKEVQQMIDETFPEEEKDEQVPSNGKAVVQDADGSEVHSDKGPEPDIPGDL